MIMSSNKKKNEALEESPLFYTKKIDNIQSSFFKMITDYREQVDDLLNTLETQGKMFFNQMHQEVMTLIQLQHPFDVMKKEANNQAKLKEFFRQMTKIVTSKDKEGFSLGRKLEQAVNTCEDKEKKLK